MSKSNFNVSQSPVLTANINRITENQEVSDASCRITYSAYTLTRQNIEQSNST